MIVSAMTILAWACAAAAPPEVHLAIVPSIIGTEGERSVFNHAATTARQYMGLDVASYDLMFLDGDAGTGPRIVACGADLGCVQRVLRVRAFDLALLLTENHELTPTLLTAELFDARQGAVVASWSGEGPITPDTWPVAVQTLLARGGFEPGGVVRLNVRPSEATVIPPERARRFGPSEWQVPVGPATFRAEAPRFVPGAVDLEIQRGAEHQATLELTPRPRSAWTSPWLWTAIGVVVIGGTATAIAVASGGEPSSRCLCVTTPGSPPCPPCP